MKTFENRYSRHKHGSNKEHTSTGEQPWGAFASPRKFQNIA